MGIVKPITRDECDWDSQKGFGVVDGVFAVFDGRHGKAEDIYQKARDTMATEIWIQASAILHEPTKPELDNSASKLANLFYDQIFGRGVSVCQETHKASIRPLKDGVILPSLKKRGFLLQKPGSYFGQQKYTYHSSGLLSPYLKFGSLLPRISRAWRQVFPEYVSHSLWRNQSSIDPGLMHFDSGFMENEHDYPAEDRRSYADIPKAFKQALLNEKTLAFTAQKFSGFTLTCAFSGQGTALIKAKPEDYEEYLQHRKSGTLTQLKNYFQDRAAIAYEIPTGAVGLMRAGVEDDHSVIPCLHFAPIKEPNDRSVRTVLYASPRVCHTHPLRSGISL